MKEPCKHVYTPVIEHFIMDSVSNHFIDIWPFISCGMVWSCISICVSMKKCRVTLPKLWWIMDLKRVFDFHHFPDKHLLLKDVDSIKVLLKALWFRYHIIPFCTKESKAIITPFPIQCLADLKCFQIGQRIHKGNLGKCRCFLLEYPVVKIDLLFSRLLWV